MKLFLEKILEPIKKFFNEVREEANLIKKVDEQFAQVRKDSGIEGKGTKEQHELAQRIHENAKSNWVTRFMKPVC